MKANSGNGPASSSQINTSLKATTSQVPRSKASSSVKNAGSSNHNFHSTKTGSGADALTSMTQRGGSQSFVTAGTSGSNSTMNNAVRKSSSFRNQENTHPSTQNSNSNGHSQLGNAHSKIDNSISSSHANATSRSHNNTGSGLNASGYTNHTNGGSRGAHATHSGNTTKLLASSIATKNGKTVPTKQLSHKE